MLGVGARADAMGNAFVALASDPTAAFWNPAGLSFLKNTEVTAVMKTLPGVSQTTYINSLDPGPFPGFETSTTTAANSAGASSGEASFLSVSTRIGKDPERGGTLSISRSLAGYLDRNWTIHQEFFPLEPGDTDSRTTVTHDKLRIDYNAISYGWKHSDVVSLGFGLVQAVAENCVSGTWSQINMDGPEPETGTIEPASITGKGYGAMLGALWNPTFLGGKNLKVGGSYLTKISLRDFDGANFGDERPDRLLLGASYRQLVAGGESGNEVEWSLQLSRTGSANIGEGGDKARSAVWNIYMGGEYDIQRGRLNCPIRYGIFTNKTPNRNVYGNETWLTLGLGALHRTDEWKAELSLQQGLRSGVSLLSFSGGYSF